MIALLTVFLYLAVGLMLAVVVWRYERRRLPLDVALACLLIVAFWPHLLLLGLLKKWYGGLPCPRKVLAAAWSYLDETRRDP